MSYLVVFEADDEGLMPITLAQEDKMFKDGKVQDDPYLQSKLEASLDRR